MTCSTHWLSWCVCVCVCVIIHKSMHHLVISDQFYTLIIVVCVCVCVCDHTQGYTSFGDQWPVPHTDYHGVCVCDHTQEYASFGDQWPVLHTDYRGVCVCLCVWSYTRVCIIWWSMTSSTHWLSWCVCVCVCEIIPKTLCIIRWSMTLSTHWLWWCLCMCVRSHTRVYASFGDKWLVPHTDHQFVPQGKSGRSTGRVSVALQHSRRAGAGGQVVHAASGWPAVTHRPRAPPPGAPAAGGWSRAPRCRWWCGAGPCPLGWDARPCPRWRRGLCGSASPWTGLLNYLTAETERKGYL